MVIHILQWTCEIKLHIFKRRGNYQNKNSNSSTLCNFFVQTKTSFSQYETKDHETLFGKREAKVHENNYDVLFDKHLTDKENKNIVENFNESVKLRENKRYEIKLHVKENLKSNLPDNYLLGKSHLESPQK